MLNCITVENALTEHEKNRKVMIINDWVVIKFGKEKASGEGVMELTKDQGGTMLERLHEK